MHNKSLRASFLRGLPMRNAAHTTQPCLRQCRAKSSFLGLHWQRSWACCLNLKVIAACLQLNLPDLTCGLCQITKQGRHNPANISAFQDCKNLAALLHGSSWVSRRPMHNKSLRSSILRRLPVACCLCVMPPTRLNHASGCAERKAACWACTGKDNGPVVWVQR